VPGRDPLRRRGPPAVRSRPGTKEVWQARVLLTNRERNRPHSRNQVGKLSGLPGPSGPDPGTVVRASDNRQASGMRIPPQIQQPAPHLRVVSRREMGKSCPTRPDGQGGSFPCTSGRSRCRCQGRSRRRSRTFCQFRVALPPSSGLTCSVRL
jgi:hypothetical protein